MKASIFILVCALLLFNVYVENKQKTYRLISEFAKLAYTNTTLFPRSEVKFFKYNRTTGVANISFAMTFEWNNDTTLRLQCQQFIDNQYKDGPVDFTVPLCPSLAREKNSNDLDIASIYSESNLTPCPVKPGEYYMNNVMIDSYKLPPFVPPGKYKTMVTFYQGLMTFAITEWYMRIEYKID